MNDIHGFLKASGQKIVNGNGKEILLRGVGLGSWMLPEGYMWCFPNNTNRPRQIEKMVTDLIGGEDAAEFWHNYRINYISEKDIKKISEEGFDSIRLPINSRNILENSKDVKLNEKVMSYIDTVINWCSKYGLYVIWDLHGAPGGQTGANIDDSENDKPELYMDENYQKMTVDLWRTLAKRYCDNPIIAGYDLLNEPLPDWNSAYYNKAMPLYKEIIKAIREVDNNHIIILEGVHWATDWSIFTEISDDNIMLQFHKYWNSPDTESIQKYLDKREELNVPIFLGESGENSTDWYSGTFHMMEDHNISWNFWTWKKMNAINSPLSVKMPVGWDLIINYLEGGPKPDKETSKKILWEYLNNLIIENCDYHPEVAQALFRTPSLRIPAIFYGYKGKGIDFEISKPSAKNVGFRINDGVNISFSDGVYKAISFQNRGGQTWNEDEWLCIEINEGDWFAYDFNVKSPSKDDSLYVSIMATAQNGDGRIHFLIDDTAVSSIEIKNNTWEEIKLSQKLCLSGGKHKLVIKGEGNPVKVQWLKLTV